MIVLKHVGDRAQRGLQILAQSRSNAAGARGAHPDQRSENTSAVKRRREDELLGQMLKRIGNRLGVHCGFRSSFTEVLDRL